MWNSYQARHGLNLLGVVLLAVGCGDGKPACPSSNPDAAANIDSTPDGVSAEPDGSVAVTDAADETSDASPSDTSESDSSTSDDSVDGPGDSAVDGPSSDEPLDGPPDVTGLDGLDALANSDASPQAVDLTAPNGDGNTFMPGPSLQLWLRGDRNVDCVPQGLLNRVSAWRDLSEHGRDALPATGKRGPLCGPSANRINNNRVVTFPRTTGMETEEHLEVDLQSIAATAFTIAIVEQRTGGEPLRHMLGSKLPFPDSIDCGINPNVGRGIVFGYRRTVNMVATTWGDNCDLNYILPSIAEKPSASFFIYSGTGTGTGTLSLFVDGVLRLSQAGAGITQISGLLGRGFEWSTEAPDSRYHGDIAEVMVFNTAINDETRQQLESYFRDNWGTPP